MAVCEACGKEVPAATSFCTSCGAMLAPPHRPGAEDRDTGAADALVWERKIPLITNPYLVLQCLVIPIGLGFFLGLVFWLISGAADFLAMFLIIGGAMAILFLIIMLFLQLATGGGLLTTFYISGEGVAHKAGTTAAVLDRAATAGSVLFGSVSGTGAGLLAMSQEFNTLEWNDVRHVSVYSGVRSIVLRSPWLISPVVLYCTEDNFEAVLSMIRKYAPPEASRTI